MEAQLGSLLQLWVWKWRFYERQPSVEQSTFVWQRRHRSGRWPVNRSGSMEELWVTRDCYWTTSSIRVGGDLLGSTRGIHVGVFFVDHCSVVVRFWLSEWLLTEEMLQTEIDLTRFLSSSSSCSLLIVSTLGSASTSTNDRSSSYDEDMYIRSIE